MIRYFNVENTSNKIHISKRFKGLANMSIYIDNCYIGSMLLVHNLTLNIPFENPRSLSLYAEIFYNGQIYQVNELHPLSINHAYRETTFQAGDILVACDNVGGLPYGYMGHSAIVVDENMIVEAVVTNPIVRKVPIEVFTNDHTIYAHFRPKSKEVGQKAALYAEQYLQTFNHNNEIGKPNPQFKFSLETPLTDALTYIYCSKLVWLSYFNGANIEFKNDHLWFSPEDLYTNLLSNKDFSLVYQHPKFIFHIDS